jgi:hypothetical protein
MGYAATSLTDLTCGHASNAAAPTSFIAAKASGRRAWYGLWSLSPWRALSVSANGMMALLDGPGAVDGSGRTVYSYAHPLFWAPYSVIKGRRRDLRRPFPLLLRFAGEDANRRRFLYRR